MMVTYGTDGGRDAAAAGGEDPGPQQPCPL
jgi:hypothetical protein